MTTHPNENTRNPCKQVRLSLAAGSVLIILPPFLMGLNAVRHVIQKPGNAAEKYRINERIRDIRIKTYFIRSCFTLFALFRVVRQIFLQAFPLLDQLLPVLLNHSVILVQILIRKIAQSLVVVRYAQRLRVLVAWRRFVLVDGSTQH